MPKENVPYNFKVCLSERNEQTKEERIKFERIDDDIREARVKIVLMQDLALGLGGTIMVPSSGGKFRKATPEDFESGYSEAILTLGANYSNFDISNVCYMAEMIKIIKSGLKMGFDIDRYGNITVTKETLINAYKKLKDSGEKFSDAEEKIYKEVLGI